MTTEPNPRANLSSMPWHIKKHIVGYTDVFSRLSLRKVSKDMRHFVDLSDAHYDVIHFTLVDDNEVRVMFTDTRNVSRAIAYRKTETGCSQQARLNVIKEVEGVHFITRTVLDIMTILRNPKLTVKNFAFGWLCECSPERRKCGKRERSMFIKTLQQELATLRHRLHVENMLLNNPMKERRIMVFLEHLKTDCLVLLQLKVSKTGTRLKKVRKTEQWMHAKELMLMGNHKVPVMKMSHFRRVDLNYLTITVDELHEFIGEIRTRNVTFERFHAHTLEHDPEDFMEYLSQMISTDRHPMSYFLMMLYDESKLLQTYYRGDMLTLVAYY